MILRSFRIISIAILSNIVAAFRSDNREVGKLFFSANNLIISPPRFNIKISEIIDSNIAGRFYLRIY